MIKRVMMAITGMGGGGAERVMSVLCNCLVRRGIEVVLCYTSTSREQSVFPLDADVETFFSESRLFPSSRFGWRFRIMNIRRKIKAFKPQIVAAFLDSSAVTMLEACGGGGYMVPVVLSARNSVKDKVNAKPERGEVYKRAYSSLSGAVFQTEEQRSQYMELFDFPESLKQAIIMNPVEPSAFWDAPRNPKPKTMAAVGRDDKRKDYPLMLRAFARAVKVYPDWTLSIYGKLRENSQIPALIGELGIEKNVELRGFCPDVAREVHSSSLFVMSSYSEGMPNALMEAMCLGLPCIATDFNGGGARELIEDGGNGIIVKSGDEEALAGAMMRLMGNAKEAERLGGAAKKLRGRVGAEETVDKWLGFFESVIKET